MGSRNVIYACCLFGLLAAVACDDNDAISGATGGSSGGGTAGSSGRGGASGNGTGGKGTGGKGTGGNGTGGNGIGGNGTGGNGTGGNGGTGLGEAGAAGAAGEPGQECTHFSGFVHTIIRDDTTGTSVPRPVNRLTFCDEPADPGEFNDLF